MEFINITWARIRINAHCLRHLLSFHTNHRELIDQITLQVRGRPALAVTRIYCQCGKRFYQSEAFNEFAEKYISACDQIAKDRKAEGCDGK